MPETPCTARYIEGPLGSGKTTRLIEAAARLIAEHPSGRLLILCATHTAQHQFKQALLQKVGMGIQEPLIYTYNGLVRTSLFNAWPLAEAELHAAKIPGQPILMPELGGLEDTELLLRTLIDQRKQQEPEAFSDFEGSSASLVRQLVRRQRLRAENRLTLTEFWERSAWLNEPSQGDVQWVEKRFAWLTGALRVLDASRQMELFHRLLETQPTFQAMFTPALHHLIADDIDETPPAQQTFIRWLVPHLHTLVLAADPLGGTRRGYLNAYPYDWPKLKLLVPGSTEVLIRTGPLAANANILLTNWHRTEDFLPLVNPSPFRGEGVALGDEGALALRERVGEGVLELDDAAMTRVEMIDRVVDSVTGHLDLGMKPGDIAIAVPKADELTLYPLQRRLGQRGIGMQCLTGTQRPIDNPLSRLLVLLVQWINASLWQAPLSPVEQRQILGALFPMLYTGVLGEETPEYAGQTPLEVLLARLTHTNGKLPPFDALPEAIQILPGFEKAYMDLTDFLVTAAHWTFEKQLYQTFGRYITPLATEAEKFQDVSRLIQSYVRQSAMVKNLERINPNQRFATFERTWLSMLKHGVVADTPETPQTIDDNALIIATPQKLIDFHVRRPLFFWLDTSSHQWARTDTAPLYHAWVHSAMWNEDTPLPVGRGEIITPESLQNPALQDHLTRHRAAHLTRGLMLLATEKIIGFSSELDDAGELNTGWLRPRLLLPLLDGQETTTQTDLRRQRIEAGRARLRDDQRAVLSYKGGTMAISAVPGAGKTFVNVELMVQLTLGGFPGLYPDGEPIQADRILALTFMDSAAKTLIQRLRKELSGLSATLPAVSTIHGLARRILCDGDASLVLGFNMDEVELLDDAEQLALYQQVAEATLPEGEKNPDSWRTLLAAGIETIKSREINLKQWLHTLKRLPDAQKTQDMLRLRASLQRLALAVAAYQEALKTQGKMDFNDLILGAIRLLEQSDALRTQYQTRYQVIIEDEAQDSSPLLQRFLGLLGGASPNLIRTGDTNQSILCTFTAADPEGFRRFIDTADQVVTMNQSGRCAPEIIALANQWVAVCGG